MGCKGRCHLYPPKHFRNRSRYIEGNKFCMTCSQHVNWLGIFCPCCSQRLRSRPRTREGKARKLAAQGARRK